MATNSAVTAGPPASTSITARRNLDIDLLSGKQHWTLSEFDDGRAVLLACECVGTQFLAHFDAKAWRAFRDLVAASGFSGPVPLVTGLPDIAHVVWNIGSGGQPMPPRYPDALVERVADAARSVKAYSRDPDDASDYWTDVAYAVLDAFGQYPDDQEDSVCENDETGRRGSDHAK